MPRRPPPAPAVVSGRRLSAVAVAAAAVLAVIPACSSGPSASSPPAAPAVATRYSGPGPYAAGTVRQTLPDGDGVQIWYPVTPAATTGHPTYTYEVKSWLPAALASSSFLAGLPDGVPTDSYQGLPPAPTATAGGDPGPRFPVVLFSHGFASYPEQSSFLTDHLAQWGFVVAAPDHRSRDLAAVLDGTATIDGESAIDGRGDVADLAATLAFLRVEDTTPGALLDGRLDFTKVGVVGHSAGGGAAIDFAADPAVRTYVALAPAPPRTLPPAGKPGLEMFGSADTLVTPAQALQVYGQLPAPKRLVVLHGAGHNVFDDFCEIRHGSERLVDLLTSLKGASAVLGQLGAQAVDGCDRPDIDPATAWPLIDQAVTAQLRYGLGIDPTPAGLGPGLAHAYPGVTATVSATS